MFECLERPSAPIKRRLISEILRKRPPTSYPLSDSPRNVDFLSLSLRDANEEPGILVTQLFETWIEGLQWDEDQRKYALPVACDLKHVGGLHVQVRHHYGPLTTIYNGWKVYRIGRLTGLSRRAYASLKIREFFGSRFVKFADDRFALLERMVEIDLKRDENSFAAIFNEGIGEVVWFQKIYGDYSFSHPNFNYNLRKFRRLIQSLVHDESLIERNSTISIGPNAMTTLSDYAIAKRRHRDAIWHNWALIALTVVLVFATALGPWISDQL